MQNERKRILAMLEDGTITTEDALTLLETLEQPKQPEIAKPIEQKTYESKTKNL